MKSRFVTLCLVGCAVLMLVIFSFNASATQDDGGRKPAPAWEHLAMSHDGVDLGGCEAGGGRRD